MSTGPSDALAEHHSYLEAILELQHRGHDVVHINAVHHLPFACAGLLSPAVVTATLHTPPTPWLESALALAAARRLLPSLASVSHANAAAWRSVDADRVIHNGVDLDRWVPGPGGGAASWWGRLVPEKAPHLAIDAARVAGVPLTLMGPIHDREYFDALVRPRLGGLVEYAGHLEVPELAAIVGRSAVAIVTPVWDEPFGLVIAEALAAGTPVAAFDSGATGELVDDRDGPAGPDGRCHGPRRRHHGGGDARPRRLPDRAEMCFSSTVMTDRYEAWFEELLARARCGMKSCTIPATTATSATSVHGRPRSGRSIWDVAGLRCDRVDVVHLHFGFEHSVARRSGALGARSRRRRDRPRAHGARRRQPAPDRPARPPPGHRHARDAGRTH